MSIVVESKNDEDFDKIDNDEEENQSDVGSIDFVEAMEENPAANEPEITQMMESAVDDQISRMFESVASSQEDNFIGFSIRGAEIPPHSSNQSTFSEFEMLDADEIDQHPIGQHPIVQHPIDQHPMGQTGQQLNLNSVAARDSGLILPAVSSRSSSKNI